MSGEELAEFAALPPLVLEDLQSIVDYALTHAPLSYCQNWCLAS